LPELSQLARAPSAKNNLKLIEAIFSTQPAGCSPSFRLRFVRGNPPFLSLKPTGINHSKNQGLAEDRDIAAARLQLLARCWETLEPILGK
jgi:hypothetical protein